MSEKDKDKTQVNEDLQQHSSNLADDRQAEDIEDKTEQEEELDEETAQVIADYSAKIEELDEQIEEYRLGNIEAMKRKEMQAMNYTDEYIQRYLFHIEGETVEEIKRSVLELTLDIPPPDNFADPSAFNGAKQRPAYADRGEIGRQAAKRIMHKIFPSLKRR